MSPRLRMAYTTYTNLSAVVQGKLDRWGVPITTSAARDAEILKAANKAQGIIHGYCSGRYASYLPFSPVPALIQLISDTMTIYFLASSQQDVGESYRRDYDQALEFLKRLESGTLGIFDETTAASLNSMGDDYGIVTNTDDTFDDYEDDDRVFPISILAEPPSTYPRTYREE